MRADMDALPVAEATGLPYASTKRADGENGTPVPVAHACGHDMHTAALVGALHLLSSARTAWSGTVVAVFQPAEETLTGAAAMIADGLFDRFPTPDIVLGQHVGVGAAGTIRYALGPAMAGIDSLRVTLFGRGGHAGWPEHTVDPVVMAAAAVMRLQTVLAREVPSAEQAVLTVGTLQAGLKDNVIPDTATMGITVRTYTPAARTLLRAATERVLHAEARASSAPRDPHLDWYQHAPALHNDVPAMTATVEVFDRLFGTDNVIEAAPIGASEDVGAYGTALGIPTVYWWLGGTDPVVFAEAQRGGVDLPFNHSPHFAPVIEPTLTTGVKALTAAALTWLGQRQT
jgi:amidohydrolase